MGLEVGNICKGLTLFNPLLNPSINPPEMVLSLSMLLYFFNGIYLLSLVISLYLFGFRFWVACVGIGFRFLIEIRANLEV